MISKGAKPLTQLQHYHGVKKKNRAIHRELGVQIVNERLNIKIKTMKGRKVEFNIEGKEFSEEQKKDIIYRALRDKFVDEFGELKFAGYAEQVQNLLVEYENI